MVGGNYKIKERISNVEALIDSIPVGEDDYSLVAKIINLEASMDEIQGSLMAEVAQIRKDNDDLRSELVIVKRAVASNAERVDRPVVRVPELKSFGGTWSAKTLENFLWEMK